MDHIIGGRRKKLRGRRKPRNISFNFEYKFGEFNKKKYRRQGGHGHSHAGEGMESGY